MVKDENTKQKAHSVLTETIYSLRVLGGYIAFICPRIVADLEAFLGKECAFSAILRDGQNNWAAVNDYTPLATRLLLDDVEAIVPKPKSAPRLEAL